MISQKILRPQRTSQFILQEALYHTQAVKIKAVRVHPHIRLGTHVSTRQDKTPPVLKLLREIDKSRATKAGITHIRIVKPHSPPAPVNPDNATCCSATRLSGAKDYSLDKGFLPLLSRPRDYHTYYSPHSPNQ